MITRAAPPKPLPASLADDPRFERSAAVFDHSRQLIRESKFTIEQTQKIIHRSQQIIREMSKFLWTVPLLQEKTTPRTPLAANHE
jgi:hypothetical protein